MKQGEVFLITCGEYSDFGIYAKLRALTDFSFDDTLTSFIRRQCPEKYGFLQQKFVAHLIESNLVEEIDIREIHVANYGEPLESPAGDSKLVCMK